MNITEDSHISGTAQCEVKENIGNVNILKSSVKSLRYLPKKLNYHKTNEVNDLLEIFVADEKGEGNANHIYSICWPNEYGAYDNVRIRFQKGPVRENGFNGITQEALLAIVIHRLQAFQSGPFHCQENSDALQLIMMALDKLKARTMARLARGVEGSNLV